MITKSEPVDVYVEYAYCECGGMLERNNVMLPTYPMQYTYKCPKCGKTETSYENYPKVVYTKKEESKCM